MRQRVARIIAREMAGYMERSDFGDLLGGSVIKPRKLVFVAREPHFFSHPIGCTMHVKPPIRFQLAEDVMFRFCGEKMPARAAAGRYITDFTKLQLTQPSPGSCTSSTMAWLSDA